MCNFKVLVTAFLVLNLHITLLNGQNYTESTPTINCTQNGYLRCIQKCCNEGEVFSKGRNSLNCVSHNIERSAIRYKIFESNKTHIETDSKFELISIFSNTTPQKWVEFDKDDVLGIMTYNMSAILLNKDTNTKLLISVQYYCVDYLLVEGELTETVQFLVSPNAFPDDLLRDTPQPSYKEAALYFPFLLLSAICFFITAVCYIFVINEDDRNIRRCFVGYTLCMGSSFLILVLLQSISSACGFLGSFFLLFTIAGFVWFTFMCLDLLLNIIYFEDGYHSKTLWITYIIASIAIPIVVVITSIAKGAVDIPDTFIKRYNTKATLCNFQNSNLATFFVPIGTALIISCICIVVCVYFKTHNNKIHKSRYAWLDKRNKYKYLCISFTLIWIALTVWITEAGVNAVMKQSIRNSALDLIEALQGIFTLIIFFSDKHTRKQLGKKCRKPSNSQTAEMIETRLSEGFLSEPQTNGV